MVLVGTGSEVHIALEAGKPLQDKDIKADVVSLPSWELFDAQPPEYRDSVLPAGELYGQFGFTAQRMAEEAENLVKGSKA